jgi:hypothetical protein
MVLSGLTATTLAQESQDPIARALSDAGPDARRFHEHVVLLSHPALEGRLPGTEGSEIAESIIMTTFVQLGLDPVFTTAEDEEPGYRQPFRFQQGGRFSDRALARIVDGFNIGAAIPGKGALSDQWVIIGAHHDHIGRGAFGSRRGQGEIHEGADDNASGTSALLLSAEILAGRFSSEDEGLDRRSVLFVTFSGEESGLNGSAHCVENLPMPIDDVALMINVDMIGRIQDDRISISGTGTGSGLGDLVDNLRVGTPLEIELPDGLTSRSDHAEFYRRGVPVLFLTEAIFPDEYHTPDDESWRINVTAGAEASRLLADIAEAAALSTARFEHLEIDGFEQGEGGPSLADIKIRFGIKPGNYGDIEPGIEVAGVSPGTSAEGAGIETGDILVAWNGTSIEGVREWMMMMTEHEPGDIVTVTVVRDKERLDLPVMLKARN